MSSMKDVDHYGKSKSQIGLIGLLGLWQSYTRTGQALKNKWFGWRNSMQLKNYTWTWVEVEGIK